MYIYDFGFVYTHCENSLWPPHHPPHPHQCSVTSIMLGIFGGDFLKSIYVWVFKCVIKAQITILTIWPNNWANFTFSCKFKLPKGLQYYTKAATKIFKHGFDPPTPFSTTCKKHSLIIGREVLILTLYVLLALQRCISWYIPRHGLTRSSKMNVAPWFR